ncbi:hypothetical protein [Amycolatopsis keratiniphila]|uniref:Uncharacterized protein n=1 Tax=Amycolatopsis keratiniphila TaxID=129921 RepID=R4SZG6_9PSEU|nr:hypothetical protein [Amycolatopsis keratiniphila]AGM08749.1 hypothetical protein AORI_6166 [Amycolatopsis keratiniphila]
MPASEINGNTAAMSAYSTKLTAPAQPSSLARPGSADVAGMFEGIAMSLLDKAATAEMTALLVKITEDMATDSATVKAIAADYTAADAASALTLATSTFKLAQQGLSLLKQASDSIGQTPESTEEKTDTSAADGSQTQA